MNKTQSISDDQELGKDSLGFNWENSVSGDSVKADVQNVSGRKWGWSLDRSSSSLSTLIIHRWRASAELKNNLIKLFMAQLNLSNPHYLGND